MTWLIGCLFDELQVELIAKGFFLDAFGDDNLNKHGSIFVIQFESTLVPTSYACSIIVKMLDSFIASTFILPAWCCSE